MLVNKNLMVVFYLLADLSQVWPEANQHFSKEIDDEANSYFQRIYNHPPHPTMSVDEVCSKTFYFFLKAHFCVFDLFQTLLYWSSNSYLIV